MVSLILGGQNHLVPLRANDATVEFAVKSWSTSFNGSEFTGTDAEAAEFASSVHLPDPMNDEICPVAAQADMISFV